jgi:putative phosphoribosyl transferase
MKSTETKPVETRPVKIAGQGFTLEGEIAVPEGAGGIVLFAHGSGSSHTSPRNRLVAQELREAGVATLLFDLLTLGEERADSMTAEYRFNIELLTGRLISATDWVMDEAAVRGFQIGYFGASTGSAAALMAAVARAEVVKAVVSRGGRPDLAQGALSKVQAPTLLIVGGNDDAVIDMNEAAMAQMRCEKRLAIVPGASHLFEEPGALNEVARLAREWFGHYLGGGQRRKA